MSEPGWGSLDPSLAELNPHTFSPDGRFALGAVEVRGAGTCRLRCTRATPGGFWESAWERELTYDPQLVRSGYRVLLFSADGDRLVRVFPRGPDRRNTADTGIEVCAADSGTVLAQWKGAMPSYLHQGAAGPAGTVVLLHYRAFYAIDTTVSDSKPVKRLNASPKHFTSVAFARDGTRLVTTSNDTAATVWDTINWDVRRRYEWQIGRLRTVAFAPDGLRCAAGSDTGQIVVWDLND